MSLYRNRSSVLLSAIVRTAILTYVHIYCSGCKIKIILHYYCSVRNTTNYAENVDDLFWKYKLTRNCEVGTSIYIINSSKVFMYLHLLGMIKYRLEQS